MAKPKTIPPSPFARHFELAAQLLLFFQIVSTALYFNGWFTNPLVHKYLLGQSTVFMAWLFYIVHCVFLRRFTLGWSPYYWPVTALALWSGIRAVTAPNSQAIWAYYIFLSILMGFPLWVTFFQQARFRQWFVIAVLFAGLAMTLACLRQWYFYVSIGNDNPPKQNLLNWGFKAMTLSTGDYDRQRLGAFLGHNNTSTAYIAIFSVYVAYTIHRLRKTGWALLFGIVLFLALAMIFLGGSRGAFLMLLASIALLAVGFTLYHRSLRDRPDQDASRLQRLSDWISAKKHTLIFGAITAVVALMAMLYFLGNAPAGQNVFKRLLTSTDLLYTGTYPRVWWMSLLMVHEHPLAGVGFGAWAHQYPFFQEMWFNAHPDTLIGLPDLGKHTQRAHNDYLHTWAELGLPGLIFLAWLVWTHIKSLWNYFRSRPLHTLAIAAATATLATMVRALVAFPFHEGAAACLFIANLALFSSYIDTKAWVWKPALLQAEGNPARWWLSPLAGFAFLIVSYPLYIYINGDYLAQKKVNRFIWSGMEINEANQYYRQGDMAQYQEHLNMAQGYRSNGIKFLEHSFRFLPNRGRMLFDYGIEIMGIGIQNKNADTIKKGIGYLQRSLNNYTYYDTFTHIGRGYRALWEMDHSEKNFDLAMQNFKRATSIMPVFYQGYVEQGLLLADSGKNDESLALLAETELRYPGFLEEGVMQAARQAENNKQWERAALLYNMAATIQPSNPKFFQSTKDGAGNIVSKGIIDFYLGIGRTDMAVNMLAGLGQYQQEDAVTGEMTKVLLDLLLRNDLVNARQLMERMQTGEHTGKMGGVWYYSSVVHWLYGNARESMVCAAHAYQLGISGRELWLLMRADADLILFPYSFFCDTILLTQSP